MDISESVYRSSGFNPCGKVYVQASRATPRYHEIYLDILGRCSGAQLSRSYSCVALAEMHRLPYEFARTHIIERLTLVLQSTAPITGGTIPLSEFDACPICGEPVKRKNLIRHYRKVHPRRASAILQAKPETGLLKSPRIRRPRRILFFILIGISIILVSAATAEAISLNTIRTHIHPQLSILIRGASETLPANIGINGDLWRDHTLDRYGVNGLSPLLTRDSSGTIHVESNTVRDFTLHEFLAVWGKPIDYSQVVGNPVQPGESACVYINGQSMSLSSDIVLVEQQKILLEIPPNSQPCSAVL